MRVPPRQLVVCSRSATFRRLSDMTASTGAARPSRMRTVSGRRYGRVQRDVGHVARQCSASCPDVLPKRDCLPPRSSAGSDQDRFTAEHCEGSSALLGLNPRSSRSPRTPTAFPALSGTPAAGACEYLRCHPEPVTTPAIELIRSPELTDRALRLRGRGIRRMAACFTAGACPLDENGVTAYVGDVKGPADLTITISRSP